MATLRIGTRAVTTSNEGKVLFPGEGITKGDVIAYYRRMAGPILRHGGGRPISMLRLPDGIDGKRFYQKRVSGYFPEWVSTVQVDSEKGPLTQAVLGSEADLAYLANQACITPHIWLSRVDDLDRPDRMIFDLDPPTEAFGPVRQAARQVRALLDELGLYSGLLTTGSKGVHVVVPLRREADFEAVRAFARDAARVLAARHDGLTDEHRKAKRTGRLFVDALRNGYAQTAVCPYCLRARPGAPVATPLAWDELDDVPHARAWTMATIGARLEAVGDPLADVARHARSLAKPRRVLDRLVAGLS